MSVESFKFGARRNLITTILTENLLSADKKLRQAASSLAYNIAWAASQATRLNKQSPYHFDEGWILEQLAAACDTLERVIESKDNEETITLIVMTIGLLTFQANDTVQELFQMLGKPALQRLTTINFTPDFTTLIKELLQL